MDLDEARSRSLAGQSVWCDWTLSTLMAVFAMSIYRWDARSLAEGCSPLLMSAFEAGVAMALDLGVTRVGVVSSCLDVVAALVLNAVHRQMGELDLWVDSADNHTFLVRAVATAGRIFAHADRDFAMRLLMLASLTAESRTQADMGGKCARPPSYLALLLFAISLRYSSSQVSGHALARAPGGGLTRCRI